MPSYITDKQIPKSWVANATLSEKDFILEELRWWDGNMNGDVIEFNSKHYSEGSTIQELCVTSGRPKLGEPAENREELPDVGYLAYFKLLNGAEYYYYQTRQQIEAFKNRYSPAANCGPWISIS